MNTSSNEIWKTWQGYKDFELREHRFREEMRPVFYRYLGITPDSHILDAGCGTGVFGRYLAMDLHKGHVTGFDINEGFIEFGKQRLKELSLEDKVTLELDDGFNLHYADSIFDAVTNYTYIGVLSDPMAGLRELIRVCKPNGTVSCVIATQSIQSVHWQGDYTFTDADELQRLSQQEREIYTCFALSGNDFHQSAEWHAFRYPKMFETCGLTEIHIYPFAHLICYNDEIYPYDYRKRLALDEVESEIAWIKNRYINKKEIYNEHGFTDSDISRLVSLLETKHEYLNHNFDHDKSYEWQGSMNFIVAGKSDLIINNLVISVWLFLFSLIVDQDYMNNNGIHVFLSDENL